MMRKRNPKKIKLSVWPYSKGEKAKLYWIDHPYRKEKQWFMDIYFQSLKTKEIEKCSVAWGMLPLLAIGRHYQDGDVYDNGSQTSVIHEDHNKKIGTFSFAEGQAFVCRRDKHMIITSNHEENEVVSNSFRGTIEGKEIRIPVIEVIRSILATNRKLLHAILEPNSFDFYFTIAKNRNDPSQIRLDFTKEYPADLLKKQHVRHLLWLSTDQQANYAWNGVPISISLDKNQGIHFPFPFKSNFQLKARYNEKQQIIRIEEIISCSGHQFEYPKAIIRSPHFKQSKSSNQSKLRKYNFIDEDDLILDTEGKGTKKTDEQLIELNMTQHEYENPPDIYRERTGKVKKRTREDENTNEMDIEHSSHVSTADVGGLDTLMGLEFKQLNEMSEKQTGDLGEFIKILTSMEVRYPNVSIQYIVDHLPEGMKGKKFCKLDDGTTLRKYLLARVGIRNRGTIYILEIERQGKSLSTLALLCKTKQCFDWSDIFNKILTSLVNKNGTWDNKVMNKLVKLGIHNERIRHTYAKRKIWELSDRIYEKFLDFY